MAPSHSLRGVESGSASELTAALPAPTLFFLFLILDFGFPFSSSFPPCDGSDPLDRVLLSIPDLIPVIILHFARPRLRPSLQHFHPSLLNVELSYVHMPLNDLMTISPCLLITTSHFGFGNLYFINNALSSLFSLLQFLFFFLHFSDLTNDFESQD